MKEKNIQELAKRMGLVTVEDMCQYTIAQLVVKIANKVNELVGEVWRFETDVQEVLKTQNENIQYLLGEGLHLEVENIFDGWVQDGTFDTLLNQSALKSVNDRIDETNAQLSQNINSFNAIKNNSEINPFTFGAISDESFDSSDIFNNIINSFNEGVTINLAGKTYYISNDINIAKSINIKNGTFVLNNSKINIVAGVSNCTFENLIFDGVNKVNDGVVITYPSSEHRFINCIFKNCLSGLKTQAQKDTEQRLYVTNCSFLSNKFGIYSKDLKRHTIVNNRFVENEVGYYSYTIDFQGLGLIFNSNYLNANQQAIRLENGLYDSTLCANIIDHNNYIPSSSYLGCGLCMENSKNRHFRNLNINGNVFRNNGDYSILITVNGSMNYCSISNNSCHLANIKDLKIDYSNCESFSGNTLSDNHFIVGTTIVSNETDINTNNSMFSNFSGGSVRGKTKFNNGIEFGNSSTFVYNSNKGYIQYHDGTSKMEGLYVVQKSANNSKVGHKQLLFADYVQTHNRPSNVDVGFMIFDSTLGKPIWKGVGEGWVDATGTTV